MLDKQNLDLFGDYTLLDQLDTVMGAVAMGYDDRGNWISNGSDSFAYDLYNRLVSVDRGAGAATRRVARPASRGAPARLLDRRLVDLAGVGGGFALG